MAFFRRAAGLISKRFRKPVDPGEELVTLEGYNKDLVRVQLHSKVQEIKEKQIIDPELLTAVETLHFALTYDRPVQRKYLEAVFPETQVSSTEEKPPEEMCNLYVVRHLDPRK